MIIPEFSEEGYYFNFTNKTDFYQFLRDINILYYDDNKNNQPYDKFIKLNYFIKEKSTYSSGFILEKFFITNEGKEFIKNILLENKYMFIA